jgi:hypothetical protein
VVMANVELNHGAPPCSVVTCTCDPEDAVSHHEHRRNTSIARMIADLMGGHFAGAYQECGSSRTPLYVVPQRTLVGRALAQRVGIHTPDDLYGGAVPHAFQATKAITHRLVGPRAHRPPGWSARFADAINEAVLPGDTAFRLPEAALAGTQLLHDGAVRIKPTHAAGGQGQSVVHTPTELEAALAALDPGQVARCGVVLERHLENVTTYSIGQVHVAGLTASYDGVQWFTPNNRGVPSYGGPTWCSSGGALRRSWRLIYRHTSLWRSRRRPSMTGRSCTTRTSSSHAEIMMSDGDAITEGLYVPGCLSNPGGLGGRAVRRSPRCSSFERTPRSRLWRPPRASATAPTWSRRPGPWSILLARIQRKGP